MPHRKSLSTVLWAFALGCSICIVTPARASFHFMQIEQVIGGVDGDTTAQAIQLRLRFFGQNFVSQARLVAYDSAGANPVLLIDLTTDVAHGDLGDHILNTSPNLAHYTTVPLASDFTLTHLIPASYLAAGRITYEDDFGTIYWSLSFGGSNYSGSTEGDFTNDNDGDFGPSFDGPLPSNGLRALQFQGTASAVSSSNASDYELTAGDAVFINNDDASSSISVTKPTISVAATDPTASEPGTNTGRFTVSRIGPTNVSLTIGYTVGGTASPGIDYSNLTGSVTIPKGKLSASIIVKPIDDVLLECPETVVATLSTSSRYTLGASSNATVTILDNELPTVSISAPDSNASEPGLNVGRFSVMRDGCTNAALRVLYRVSGTAMPGIDYSNLVGPVTIPKGKLMATIAIKPIDDTLVEGTETVVVTISNRPNYLISSPGSATVRIFDND